MSVIAIDTHKKLGTAAHKMLERVLAVTNSIRDRTLGRFPERLDAEEGKDWLQVELDAVFMSPHNTVDHQKLFKARLWLPDSEPQEIELPPLSCALTGTAMLPTGNRCRCQSRQETFEPPTK